LSRFICLESAKHLVAEASTKSSDGLRPGVVGGLAFGNVRLSGPWTTDLRNAIRGEGNLGLMVATAI
jgi:hypothetical protein